MTPDFHEEQPAENQILDADLSRKFNNRWPPRPCRRVQNCLTAYIDGDLKGKTRENVARHLEGCAACRHELRLLVQSEQALTASAHSLAAPGDLRAGFYARLAAAPRPVNKWRATAPAFAVCGLLLLVSGTLYRLHEPSSNVASVLINQSDSHSRAVAGVTPIVVSGRAYGMPADAKPLPSIVLRPHTQIALDDRAGQPVSAVRRWTQKAHPARPLIASLSAKRNLAAAGTARNRRLAQHQRLIAIARYSAAASHSALAFTTKPDLSKKRNMQVASVTRSERDAFSLADRAAFGRARSRQSAFANKDTAQAEALNSSNAPSPAPRPGVFRDDANAALSLSSVGASASSTAFGYTGYGEDETDGVRFQVKDAQRGFTAATRSESRIQRQNGRQVLSIHLEDQDASNTNAPEQPKINVEVEPNTGTGK